VHAREGLDVDQRLRRYYLFKKIEAGSAKWFITVPPPISGVVHESGYSSRGPPMVYPPKFFVVQGKIPSRYFAAGALQLPTSVEDARAADWSTLYSRPVEDAFTKHWSSLHRGAGKLLPYSDRGCF